jgi:hypothetical protein
VLYYINKSSVPTQGINQNQQIVQEKNRGHLALGGELELIKSEEIHGEGDGEEAAATNEERHKCDSIADNQDQKGEVEGNRRILQEKKVYEPAAEARSAPERKAGRRRIWSACNLLGATVERRREE